jgi:hypothetical protein
MNRFVQTSRGRRPVRAAGPVGNDEGEADAGNPMAPLAERLQHSLDSEPHERQPGGRRSYQIHEVHCESVSK